MTDNVAIDFGDTWGKIESNLSVPSINVEEFRKHPFIIFPLVSASVLSQDFGFRLVLHGFGSSWNLSTLRLNSISCLLKVWLTARFKIFLRRWIFLQRSIQFFISRSLLPHKFDLESAYALLCSDKSLQKSQNLKGSRAKLIWLNQDFRRVASSQREYKKHLQVVMHISHVWPEFQSLPESPFRFPLATFLC